MDKTIKIIRTVLVSFFLVWTIIFFSFRAYNKESKGEDNDRISSLMISLSKIPYQIKDYFKDRGQAIELTHSEDLHMMGYISKTNALSDSIFLLHSKIIDKESIWVYLEDVKNGDVAWNWEIPVDKILNDLDSIREDLILREKINRGPINLKNWIANGSNNIIIRHSIMLKDSSLVFKIQDLGIIYKIDKHSKLIWKSKKLAHHSIERDESNNFWVGSIDLENKLANSYGYRDDALLCFDLNGNEIYFKSLTDIFIENNLFSDLIESTPTHVLADILDPYHLNDIEPVKFDTPYWNKGDLFISLRHKSLVFLYRPITGKIIWFKQGPWLGQHDIVIEDDHKISLFNNNISFLKDDIDGTSNLAIFDFETDSVKFYANGIFRSKTEGRQSKLSNGEKLIESTNEGIYYVLDSLGDLKTKFYIPFEKNESFAQYPGWSRSYIKRKGVFYDLSN